MLLDSVVAICGILKELALLCELLTGRLPPPPASLPASSATALPTPSTGPFAVETTEKLLTRQVSTAVRLQAVARGLLACRRVGRLSVRKVVPTLTSTSAEIYLSMAGAKQLVTRGLSWFRPGPYVQ
jgi:hypothetical protein